MDMAHMALEVLEVFAEETEESLQAMEKARAVGHREEMHHLQLSATRILVTSRRGQHTETDSFYLLLAGLEQEAVGAVKEAEEGERY